MIAKYTSPDYDMIEAPFLMPIVIFENKAKQQPDPLIDVSLFRCLHVHKFTLLGKFHELMPMSMPDLFAKAMRDSPSLRGCVDSRKGLLHLGIQTFSPQATSEATKLPIIDRHMCLNATFHGWRRLKTPHDNPDLDVQHYTACRQPG